LTFNKLNFSSYSLYSEKFKVPFFTATMVTGSTPSLVSRMRSWIRRFTTTSLFGGFKQAANYLGRNQRINRKTWKSVTPKQVWFCPSYSVTVAFSWQEDKDGTKQTKNPIQNGSKQFKLKTFCSSSFEFQTMNHVTCFGHICNQKSFNKFDATQLLA